MLMSIQNPITNSGKINENPCVVLVIFPGMLERISLENIGAILRVFFLLNNEQSDYFLVESCPPAFLRN